MTSAPSTPDDTTGGRGFRFTLRSLLLWTAGIAVLFCVFRMFLNAVQTAGRAAATAAAQCPLNQLLLALHNYHDAYGRFPPAFLADPDGKPMHSWRVLILPYVEEQALYDAYDFNEPWDGPNNSRLANRMPRTFLSPSEPPSSIYTNIVTLTGPGTAFPGSSSTMLDDFADGTDNTILLAEISRSTIPWLEPRDLDVGQMSFRVNDPDRPSISCVWWRQPYVVFADCVTGFRLSDDIPPAALKALTTIAGGEPVTRDGLLAEGHLE